MSNPLTLTNLCNILTNLCKYFHNALQFSTCLAKHYWSDKARQWFHLGLIISTIGNHFLLDRLISKMPHAIVHHVSHFNTVSYIIVDNDLLISEKGTFSRSILPQQSCSKASSTRRQPENKLGRGAKNQNGNLRWHLPWRGAGGGLEGVSSATYLFWKMIFLKTI